MKQPKINKELLINNIFFLSQNTVIVKLCCNCDSLTFKKMPITFQVSNVKVQTICLNNSEPFSPEQILPLSPERSWNSRTMEEPKSPYDTTPIQSSFAISSSTSKANPIIQFGCNSFVMSGVQAYSKHHNWVIKPDDVWLAICTQFSNYVNGKSEELRDKLVDFKGKKELVVYDSGNLFSADYVSLSLEMTNQIAANIKDPSVRNWVMPDFTTTTQIEKMVGAVVLMASMKNFFDYKFCLDCNLPNVTLLGELEDWIKIRERANRLLEFDTKEGYMGKLCEFLFPVLDQFVETIKGNPNKEWWNRVVNLSGGGSGPSYLSGWITTFCVFNNEGKWQGETSNLDRFGKMKTLTSEWPIIDDQDVPRGYVTVPILVDDNGTEYKTEMFAGHMVSDILGEDGKTLQPRVDWALFLLK